MTDWFNKSIARRLGAAFFAVFITTYMLTAFIVYGGAKQSITQSENDSLSQYTNLKLERIGNEVEQMATNLQAWASLEVMNDLISGDVDKRVARTLEGLKQRYAGFDGGDVYAFDSNGKLIATSSRQNVADIVMPAQWLPVTGLKMVDKHQNQFAPTPMLALIIPIAASFSPDYKVGYLAITYPWSEVEKLIFDNDHKMLLLRQGNPPSILATDLTGEIDVHLLESKTASLTFNEVNYIAGRSGKRDPWVPDWQIVALKAEKDALEPLAKVGLELLALGLLLGIPIMLGIRWLSKKLTDPLHELTDFVTDITYSGDLSKRAGIRSQDELGTLSKAFNQMAENLDQITTDRERFVGELENLNRTLEQRIQERTHAMESANTGLTKTIQALKDAQGQLVQSEKMASLGQLVAGVAHELNNPVGFIYANMPQLEEYVKDLLALIDTLLDLPMDESSRKLVEQEIKKIDLDFLREDVLEIIHSGKSGASRIKEIVYSLRSFSRLDESELKSVLLEDGINDTLAILNHQIKGRIKVVKDYQLNEPVTCFAGHVNQVFMNIIFNGIQAISGEGTLTISTRKENEWAIITIEDSGAGIPQDIINKIFDPFFTTKRIGEGTGLGLSISYGIIKKHGGRIEVESEAGKGTRFLIRLKLNPEIDRRTIDLQPEVDRRKAALNG
jgi:signal transduction histidine kinase